MTCKGVAGALAVDVCDPLEVGDPESVPDTLGLEVNELLLDGSDVSIAVEDGVNACEELAAWLALGVGDAEGEEDAEPDLLCDFEPVSLAVAESDCELVTVTLVDADTVGDRVALCDADGD
jgi:hypothetical protein